MTTAEYVKNIQNVSNEDLMNNLETCGHDGYYNDLYYPVIKELKRRLKYYKKEVTNSLPTAQPERMSCDGCRWERFGSSVCNSCARSFADRYESADMRED